MLISKRLCPGMLANICASFSLLGATRGPRVRSGDSETMPARRLAARVVRGAIVGVTCEAGIGRALKLGVDVPSFEVRLPPLLPPCVCDHDILLLV